MLDRTEFIMRAGLLLRLMQQLLDRQPTIQSEFDDIQRDWEILQGKWRTLIKQTNDEGILRLLREANGDANERTSAPAE